MLNSQGVSEGPMKSTLCIRVIISMGKGNKHLAIKDHVILRVDTTPTYYIYL